MTEPATKLPDELEAAEAVAERALSLPDEARAVVINSAQSFASAGEFLVYLKRRIRELEDAFDPSVRSAHDTHKRILAVKQQALKSPQEAEGIVKRAMADYQREQDRLRAEAERRAADERRRQEAEARAVAEAEQRRLQAEEEARRLDVAAIAESVGDHEGAARILEETPTVPTPEPEPVVPQAIAVPEQAKASGVSFRKVYRYRITNRGAIARQFLIPDEKAIGATVRALGPEAVSVVGGIVVEEELSVAARAR